MIGDEKRPGRPSLEPGSVSRTWPIRVGPLLDDKASRIALRHGLSVPEVFRRALRKYDPDEDDE